MTLDEIVRRNSLRRPDKLAISMHEKALSWKQLNTRVNQLANAFTQNNFVKGDRVAILSANCPEYLEIYFAIARSGLIAVPVNYRLTSDELVEILQHAEPKLLIVANEFLQQAEEVQGRVNSLNSFWLIAENEKEGIINYENTLQAGSKTIVESRADEKDCFAIFYTSGTTGLPKGAMISHYNLEMNGYNQIIADSASGKDSNLISSPIYHMGAVFMAISYMMLGCTQYILSKFTAEGWLALMQSSKASVSLLIPTMINAVVNDKKFGDYNLQKLRLIFYGGGPMPPAVLKRAISGLNCSFNQGYGLTETLEATFLGPDDHVTDGNPEQQKRLASCGQEAVGAEVRIVNDEAEELATNEIGEIIIRSRSVISAYWNLPEESEKAIRNGWFFTGDLGYLDEDRYLYLVDRKKDMVISGGVNIYTREIENRLFQHSSVLEAAVIALADDEWGEIVTAVVVLKDGEKVKAEELIEFCAEKLASYKKPKKVLFIDSLPKNPSGKVLKRELRQSLIN